MKTLRGSLGFPGEFKHGYRFSRKPNGFPVHETTKSLAMAMSPEPSPLLAANSLGGGGEEENGIGSISYGIVVLSIGLFFLFAFIVKRKKKKAVKSGKEEVQRAHGGESPVIIRSPGPETSTAMAKTVNGVDGGIKREEEEEEEEEVEEGGSSELVFFVRGEEERFRLEDLLESGAELQSQSLWSNLYKVRLKNGGVYAVKRLRMLQQGISHEEFGKTMRRIGNLRHPNILPLVCYTCTKEQKLLLVYKYQRNGSLLALFDDYIDGKREFPWRQRLSIAIGIARGLEFIHRKTGGDQEGKPPAHGGIKLSNILLNDQEEPLISEYYYGGYSKLEGGYRAPEMMGRGAASTEEGDAFSFGVILLELLTGKTVERNAPVDLPKWVKSMVREEWTGEVFDREVNAAGKQWAFPMLNIALKCVAHFPENRPSLADVLEKIEEVVNNVNAEDADADADDAQQDMICINNPAGAAAAASSSSPCSSFESINNLQDGSLLHTVIPETWDSSTPSTPHPPSYLT